MYTERLKIDLIKMITHCDWEINKPTEDTERVEWFKCQKYAFESVLEILMSYDKKKLRRNKK